MDREDRPSRQSGLIVMFDLGSGEAITEALASAWIDPERTAWYHFDRLTDAAASWLLECSNLEQIVIDELLAGSTRPQVRMIEDGLLLTLRGVNLNPGADPEDMISIRIWADSRRLVSFQGPRLLAIESIIAAFRDGHGPRSIGEMIIAIVGGLTERMNPVIEKINVTIDSFEDRVIDSSGSISRQELTDVRQRVITLHRYLAPQVDALQDLNEAEFEPLNAGHRQLLNEQINQLRRYVEDLEAAKVRAAVVQDELSNQLAEQANERVYIVTIIAAIFLPLSFVTGVLGMNVGGMPLTEHPMGFIGVTLGMGVAGALLFWALKRSRWL